MSNGFVAAITSELRSEAYVAPFAWKTAPLYLSPILCAHAASAEFVSGRSFALRDRWSSGGPAEEGAFAGGGGRLGLRSFSL